MSDSIYQNKPYTYLIKFIPTGQVYYGVRWGNKVSPEDDLWKKYFTSSKYVKELIDEYGAEWFEYEIRQKFDTAEKARLWEETVLMRMKVVGDDKWLNKTDNHSIILTEDSWNRIRETNLKRYGAEYPFQSEEIKEKIRETTLAKYGVDNYTKTDEYHEKFKNISLERYGTEHPQQNGEVYQKGVDTRMNRYGVEHVLQNNNIKQKMINTTKERYGEDNYTKTSEFKERYKNTCNEKYGVDNVSQCQEVKDKKKKKSQEKYGTDYPLQSEEVKLKMKYTNIERYGVEHINQLPERKALLSENGKKIFSKRYKCAKCEFISNAGNVGKHHKRTSHTGKIELGDEI